MLAECSGCNARDKQIKKLVLKLNDFKSQLKLVNKGLCRNRKKTPHINEGLKFEELVLKLIKGAIGAPGGGPYDIKTQTGKKVEVKFSELNSPTGSKCKRWDWASLYGHRGVNKWNYLILGGKKDPRFMKIYKEKKSPYVYFLLDWNATKRVRQPGNKVGHIAATTNIDKMHRNNIRGRLLWQYEMSEKEIKRFFARM